jgi:hypothetical protein
MKNVTDSFTSQLISKVLAKSFNLEESDISPDSDEIFQVFPLVDFERRRTWQLTNIQ